MSRDSKLGKLDPNTLLQYESVQTWLNKVAAERTGSDRTRVLYLMHFARYVEYTGKNPDELKVERATQLRSDSEDVNQTVERRLNEYFAWLQKQGLTRNYASQHLVAVRSFYTASYGRLRSRQPQKTRSYRLKPPLPEEMEKLWQYASIRDRALIAWLKDTG